MHREHANMYDRVKSCLEDHLYGRLHEFLKKREGGLFPEQVDIAHVRCALDVACGSGEWILDMAFKYPRVQFVGLDYDPQRISYARAYARVLGLDNVNFIVSDMLCMNLPTGCYDLVHGRFLSAVITPSTQLALCDELLRVCTARGRVVLRELLYPTTNSEACDQWCEFLRLAMQRAEHLTGAVDDLDHPLCKAGCRAVHRLTTMIDISSGMFAHRMLCAKTWEMMEFTKPFFLYHQVISESYFERLSAEVMMDLDAETFRGKWPLLTLIGRK